MIPVTPLSILRNLTQTLKKIDQTKNAVVDILKKAKNLKLMSYHKEFSYFVHDFGLNFLGEIEEVPGVPPSAGRIARVALEAKNKKVDVVLASTANPQKFLKRFKEISGVHFKQIPISIRTNRSPTNYEELLVGVAKALSRETLMSLIKTHKLSIGYESALQNEISFNLANGELLLVDGPNGSGKSTFLKTLLGQIEPIEGSIEFGKDNLILEHLPQIISYDLPFSITLREILESHEVPSEKLAFFDKELLAKRWNECSGGEKQKALILSRIGTHCDVLILDEPFNHVDQKSIVQLGEFLVGLLKSEHVGAMIVVSHIPSILDDIQSVKQLSFQC